MSLENLLKDEFKLSLYEAKIYLALLKGKMGPKEISKLSRVPLSRVYDTLRTLQEKGFAVQTDQAYVAVAPMTALSGRLIQFKTEFEREHARRAEAQKRLEQLLRTKSGSVNTAQDLMLLKGIYAIMNKFIEILGSSKDVFLTAKKAIEAKDLFKPYLESGTRLTQKKIRVLIPSNVSVSSEEKKLVSKSGLDVRRADGILLDILEADQRDVVIGVPDPLSEEVFHAIGIWIRNVSFAKSIHETLEEIWKNARPL